MKHIAIIRNRGQLTLPDSFRKRAGWLSVNNVVNLELQDSEKIVCTPLKQLNDEYWDKLFTSIKHARDIKGKASKKAKDYISDKYV